MQQFREVKVKKVDPNAIIPTTAYGEDVGYDVYALEDVDIPYGAVREIRTGLAFEPPTGYYFTVETRSCFGRAGKSIHHGIIDPGYRGEITIHIRNTATNTMVKDTLSIKRGEKIAQLVFHRAIYVQFTEVTELGVSERGEKNYGSSGQ